MFKGTPKILMSALTAPYLLAAIPNGSLVSLSLPESHRRWVEHHLGPKPLKLELCKFGLGAFGLHVLSAHQEATAGVTNRLPLYRGGAPLLGIGLPCCSFLVWGTRTQPTPSLITNDGT